MKKFLGPFNFSVNPNINSNNNNTTNDSHDVNCDKKTEIHIHTSPFNQPDQPRQPEERKESRIINT